MIKQQKGFSSIVVCRQLFKGRLLVLSKVFMMLSLAVPRDEIVLLLIITDGKLNNNMMCRCHCQHPKRAQSNPKPQAHPSGQPYFAGSVLRTTGQCKYSIQIYTAMRGSG